MINVLYQISMKGSSKVLYSSPCSWKSRAVLEAMQQLPGTNEFEMTQVPEPLYGLTEQQVETVVRSVAISEATLNLHNDDVLIDIIEQGFIGVSEWSVNELMNYVTEEPELYDEHAVEIAYEFLKNKAASQVLLGE